MEFRGISYERLSHDWEALKGIKIAIKNVDRTQGAHGRFGEIANPGARYTKRRRLLVWGNSGLVEVSEESREVRRNE